MANKYGSQTANKSRCGHSPAEQDFVEPGHPTPKCDNCGLNAGECCGVSIDNGKMVFCGPCHDESTRPLNENNDGVTASGTTADIKNIINTVQNRLNHKGELNEDHWQGFQGLDQKLLKGFEKFDELMGKPKKKETNVQRPQKPQPPQQPQQPSEPAPSPSKKQKPSEQAPRIKVHLTEQDEDGVYVPNGRWEYLSSKFSVGILKKADMVVELKCKNCNHEDEDDAFNDLKNPQGPRKCPLCGSGDLEEQGTIDKRSSANSTPTSIQYNNGMLPSSAGPSSNYGNGTSPAMGLESSDPELINRQMRNPGLSGGQPGMFNPASSGANSPDTSSPKISLLLFTAKVLQDNPHLSDKEARVIAISAMAEYPMSFLGGGFANSLNFQPPSSPPDGPIEQAVKRTIPKVVEYGVDFLLPGAGPLLNKIPKGFNRPQKQNNQQQQQQQQP